MRGMTDRVERVIENSFETNVHIHSRRSFLFSFLSTPKEWDG